MVKSSRKFSVGHLLAGVTACCIVFAVNNAGLLYAIVCCPPLFGPLAAHATLPGKKSCVLGFWRAAIYTTVASFAVSPFAVMCWYGGLERVSPMLVIGVAIYSSLLAGVRAAESLRLA